MKKYFGSSNTNSKNPKENMKERNIAASPNDLTLIGVGTKVKGSIISKENIRVEGSINGKIDCEGKVFMGNESHLVVDLKTYEVNIDGTFEGDIKAEKQLVIGSNGVMNGNMSTPSLIVENGAVLNGKVEMPRNKEEQREQMKKG